MFALPRMISSPADVVRRHLDGARLDDLNDAQLRDLGLARRDAVPSLRSAYFRDPSSVLRWLCCQGPMPGRQTLHGCC
jgi:hypothetical protein